MQKVGYIVTNNVDNEVEYFYSESFDEAYMEAQSYAKDKLSELMLTKWSAEDYDNQPFTIEDDFTFTETEIEPKYLNY